MMKVYKGKNTNKIKNKEYTSGEKYMVDIYTHIFQSQVI